MTVAVALLTADVAACGRSAERACPAYATTALTVRVEDARTAVPIASGAVMSLSYGGREPETHTFATDDELYSVLGEAGRYDVRVTKPGYQPWERRRILRPDLDGCGHTSPVDVIARLDPDR